MAQLKEGSVIKKSTGDEVIATVNEIEIIREMFTTVLGDYELGIAPSLGEIVEEMKSNKITIGKTQPNSGWWFEEID
jgi:hypothetical protein